jgi:hypothetical protein
VGVNGGGSLQRGLKRLKSESAFKELTSILTEEDLKAMMESVKSSGEGLNSDDPA